MNSKLDSTDPHIELDNFISTDNLRSKKNLMFAVKCVHFATPITYKVSKILALSTLRNWFKLVLGQFVQSSMHRKFNFYARPAWKYLNVVVHNYISKD